MGRKSVYDYIRVIACICVIGIHCTVALLSDVGSVDTKITAIIHIFFRIGLPIFYMLSGALLLSDKRSMTVLEFYRKRLIHLLIPLFLYSLFYGVWVNGGKCWEVFRDTFVTYQSVHLWFMYSIIGIYLVIPFLKIMVQNMETKNLKELFVFLVVMRCITNYVPWCTGITIGVDHIFSGWILYVLLGYILIQDNFRAYYKRIEILGSIAFLAACSVYIWKPEWMTPNFFDLSPIMILEASGMFIFFYRREQWLCKNERLNKGMWCIAKYTFSIYMVHEFVRCQLEPIRTIIPSKVVCSLVWICSTFIVSFGIAVIIDNTVIKFVQFIVDKLIDFLGRCVKKYSTSQTT